MYKSKSKSEVYAQYPNDTFGDITKRTWFHFYRWLAIEVMVGIIGPILILVSDLRVGGGQPPVLTGIRSRVTWPSVRGSGRSLT